MPSAIRITSPILLMDFCISRRTTWWMDGVSCVATPFSSGTLVILHWRYSRSTPRNEPPGFFATRRYACIHHPCGSLGRNWRVLEIDGQRLVRAGAGSLKPTLQWSRFFRIRFFRGFYHLIVPHREGNDQEPIQSIQVLLFIVNTNCSLFATPAGESPLGRGSTFRPALCSCSMEVGPLTPSLWTRQERQGLFPPARCAVYKDEHLLVVEVPLVQ